HPSVAAILTVALGDWSLEWKKQFPHGQGWKPLIEAVYELDPDDTLSFRQRVALWDRVLEHPAYVTKCCNVSGVLKSAGSDTMRDLVTAWREQFKRAHPESWIEIDSRGSETTLRAGSADIILMSRKMTRGEISQFKTEFGYEPKGLPVALDTLAV